MGLDTSIPLQQTQVQMPNVMGMYANQLAMQNAQQQNRFGEVQYANAMRTQQDDEAARQIYMGGGDVLAGLKAKGLYKQAEAFEKSQMERRAKLASIDKDELDAGLKRADALSGVFGSLASKGPAVTLEDVQGAIKGLTSQGILTPELATKALASMPLNTMQLPQYIVQGASAAEQGRKALTMIKQEIEYLDIGGVKVPVNKNAMAPGGVGPTGGAAIAKTISPEGAATDARAAAQLAEQKRHNATTEGLGRERETRDAAKEKSLTDSQGAATAYGIRAREAQDILSTLEGKGTFGRMSGAKEGVRDALERVPVVGTAVGNVAGGVLNATLSDAQQSYEQAKRNFISAVLRKESGAVISPEEFRNEDRKYFPQTGDGDVAIKQKKKARETAISALSIQAGPGAKNITTSIKDMSDAAIKQALGL